jgi:hypothetical protein
LALAPTLLVLAGCTGGEGAPAGAGASLPGSTPAAEARAQPTNAMARLGAPTATPMPDPAPALTPPAAEPLSTAVATSAAAPTALPAGPSPHPGIWLSEEEIAALPTSGPAWGQLKAVAAEPLPDPDLTDQDDGADVALLAKALVYARTGEEPLRQEVLAAIEALIDSENELEKASVLAIARNLPAYVIAADLVNLPAETELDEQFRSWLHDLRETEFRGSIDLSLGTCQEMRPNNWGTHCGAARVAVDRYLNDAADLAQAATVFRGYLGDRDAYAGFEYGRLDWQADPDRPVGINPTGATKEGHSIDGSLPEEMRRAGGEFRWPPKKTQYAWEALQGALLQAELLHRAGFPAWEWQDRALLRAVQFLYDIDWPAQGDDEWQPWLVNHAYGTHFAAFTPARPGKNVGWTDWTHPPSGDPVTQGESENE